MRIVLVLAAAVAGASLICRASLVWLVPLWERRRKSRGPSERRRSSRRRAA
jgi:hypothetical protein